MIVRLTNSANVDAPCSGGSPALMQAAGASNDALQLVVTAQAGQECEQTRYSAVPLSQRRAGAMAAHLAAFFAASSISDPEQLQAATEAAHAALSGAGAASRPRPVQVVSTDMLLNAAANDDVLTTLCVRCSEARASQHLRARVRPKTRAGRIGFRCARC